VACGTGNAALVAARRYCHVTGIDYVPKLIERAERRAAADGLAIDFRVGDAQELPLPDDSFDVVLSVFGVMFAPDQERTAGELVRVCRPGGRIGLANHIPEGWAGDFFALHAEYAPPPPGVASPMRWGSQAVVEQLLGEGVTEIESRRRTFLQYFPTLDDAVEIFVRYFGPTRRVIRTIDEDAQAAFRKEMAAVLSRHNRGTDDGLVVESPYLMTIATCA
jgi:ubiquinone/menaquinone biosynthesis C-methylase UbiE